MSKLAIFLAIFSLVTLRHVIGNEDKSCQEQIRNQSDLQNCQSYLSLGYKSQLESLNECCRELGNMNEQCRCHAINHAFVKQRGQGELEGLQRRAAENLPSRCKLSTQACQIESIWD